MGGSESSQGSAPQVEHGGSAYNETVIRRCPLLSERYAPPALWGKSGHLQCILFCATGRYHQPSLVGISSTLVTALAEDGATVSFDLFQRCCDTPGEAAVDYDDTSPWVLLAPGVCNNSQTNYIIGFVNYILSTHSKWRVAVLNHLGTDDRVRLTSARIFTLGCTEPFDLMVNYIRRGWPAAPLLAVGFSLGANIIMKYLGEEPSRQSWFRAAVSCCQGYNYMPLTTSCETSRMLSIYSFTVAKRVLGVISHNRDLIFQYWRAADENSSRSVNDSSNSSSSSGKAAGTVDGAVDSVAPTVPTHSCGDPSSLCSIRARKHGRFPGGILVEESTAPRGTAITEAEVMSATQVVDVDRRFNAPINKYANVDDYLAASSSAFFMHNVADIPVLLFNADDDPVSLWEQHYQYPRKMLEINPKSMFVHTQYGSHMAFFTGGWLLPTEYNRLDQIILQYADAVLSMDDGETLPTTGTGSTEESE